MPNKIIGLTLALASMTAIGANSIAIKDNSDIALTLSQGNYNRIVIKNDKINEAVFPPNSMDIKRDEQDGSVYVMLAAANPFTLFLSTEAGRHFSVTVNAEESLGKTIELVPQQVAIARTNIIKNNTAVPEAILAMLTHMEQHKPFADVVIKHQSGSQLWSKGLEYRPKESWDSKLLKGEVIELYNGGKKPLLLDQEWFSKDGVVAVKFSKPAIAPKEVAMLYRVTDVTHG